MNSTRLTRRQQEVLDFLVNERGTTGIVPSVREIAKHFGFRSPNTVCAHLKALEAKGLIRRILRKARGVLIELRGLETSLSVVGSIPAGMPVRSSEGHEGKFFIQCESFHAAPGSFVLRVSGESMKDAGIIDGDMVVVEKCTPTADDIVVALIDGESTLKRLSHRNGAPVLKAENPKFADIEPREELEVQGVVTAVFRTIKRSK